MAGADVWSARFTCLQHLTESFLRAKDLVDMLVSACVFRVSCSHPGSPGIMATSEPMPPAKSADGVVGPALLISSDGHAIANMEDYRSYLPSRMREDFDAFCVDYREYGGRRP
jgi:hypothetical protein